MIWKYLEQNILFPQKIWIEYNIEWVELVYQAPAKVDKSLQWISTTQACELFNGWCFPPIDTFVNKEVWWYCVTRTSAGLHADSEGSCFHLTCNKVSVNRFFVTSWRLFLWKKLFLVELNSVSMQMFSFVSSNQYGHWSCDWNRCSICVTGALPSPPTIAPPSIPTSQVTVTQAEVSCKDRISLFWRD